MIVEPDLDVHADGDRLIVGMAGEVVALDPDRAFSVACAAIAVALRGRVGTVERLCYWIERESIDAAYDRLDRAHG